MNDELNATVQHAEPSSSLLDLDPGWGAANDDWLLALARQLRDGSVADGEFDKLYPPSVRAVSSSFWTPVDVAVRAARLLVRDASTRVLDVGSGAGKLGIVGAAVTGATFVGVEHRVQLVEVARAAARRLRLETRALFHHATFDALEPAGFDAFYFFNPFEENLWTPGHRLDPTVELSQARFHADITKTARMLLAARPGTRVVTYHGLGCPMPSTYERALRERHHSGYLELWVKTQGPEQTEKSVG